MSDCKEENEIVPQGSAALYRKYEAALRLYIAESELSRSEVCRRCGVDYGSFTHYVRRYYPQYLRSGRRSGSAYRKRQKEQTKRKYREAVRLYATTELTTKEICARTGNSVNGFRKYINTYHRELLLERNDLHVSKREAKKIRLRRGGTGQTLVGHRKYKEAIAACGDERYIAYNVSQIARMFHLNGSALGHQLRIHYPDILQLREKERMRRGLSDNQRRGARCAEQYADAIELLRTTDRTIRQVADACKVSFSGLKLHLLQYHKDVVMQRAERRREARNSRQAGRLNGSGSVNGPKASTVARYGAAVELYRTTLLPLKEIALRTQVSVHGLTHHLYRWHRGEVLKRKGIETEERDEYADLSGTRHYLRSTREKYAEAIARLREGAKSLAEVAGAYGFDADVFRDYIRKHEPRLARQYGQRRLENGKRVWRRSSEKYGEAVELYRTTAEPLKSIAQRLGLVYNSLGGYIRRNVPEAIARHKALVEKEPAKMAAAKKR